MPKKYIVELTSEERSHLERLQKEDRVPSYRRKHAHILLLADQSPDGPHGQTKISHRPLASPNAQWKKSASG